MNVNFGPGFGQPTAAQDFGMAAAGLGTGLGEAAIIAARGKADATLAAANPEAYAATLKQRRHMQWVGFGIFAAFLIIMVGLAFTSSSGSVMYGSRRDNRKSS